MKITRMAARKTGEDCPYVGEHWWDIVIELDDGRILKGGHFDRLPPTLEDVTEHFFILPETWEEIDKLPPLN